MFDPKRAHPDAYAAAGFLRDALDIKEDIPLGLILGSGWNKAFEWENSIPFENIPGFVHLPPMAGHPRRVAVGTIAGKRVITLCGQVHLKERFEHPLAIDMLRLQIEMLFALGVERLIDTCSAGGMRSSRPGSVKIIKAFITLYAPELPFSGIQDVKPGRALNIDLKNKAEQVLRAEGDKDEILARYLVSRGPWLETLEDKEIITHQTDVIGNGLLSDACLCDLHSVPMLVLAFISNNKFDPITQLENVKKGEERSAYLNKVLTNVITVI